jgi:hypothetical protein
MMPRKLRTIVCYCGCGEETKGGKFRPGHDAKLLSALIEAIGGIESLRTLVEKKVGRTIIPK